MNKCLYILILVISSLTLPSCQENEPEMPSIEDTDESSETDEDNSSDDETDDSPGSTDNDNIRVRTWPVTDPTPGHQTFRGTLNANNVSTDAEVGFELSSDPDFSRVRKWNIPYNESDFSVEVDGILDQFTYYLRAYAIINGMKINGKTETFTTPELTYQINGKSYKMIKVEGGPLGDFSIMQTEFPVEGGMVVNGAEIHAMTSNNRPKNQCTKGVTREIWRNLIESSGLHFRFPTLEEWEYAARGGKLSKGYIYSGSDNYEDVAWCKGLCTRKHSPCEKAPNELGLYDMSGNLSEFCVSGLDIYILESNLDTANFFNKGWNSGYAMGGNWASEPLDCTPSSCYPIEEPSTNNYFFCDKITFRFVYSRDPYHDCNFVPD